MVWRVWERAQRDSHVRRGKQRCHVLCVFVRDFEGFDDWMITTPQILEAN